MRPDSSKRRRGEKEGVVVQHFLPPDEPQGNLPGTVGKAGKKMG
jgi:hypothetical protein